MGSEDDGGSGDLRMFAIFMFSILLLVLIPLTIWRISTGASSDVAVLQPWEKKRNGGKQLSSYFNRFNIVLVFLWAVVIGLGMYISTIQLETEPFNPFSILGVEETATEQEIKKAYKKLVIQHHPDKIKDPILKKEAETFFAEKLAKAHQALTDETARENWIKYGHPDGPQAMNIGVALPEWVFAQDRRTAPLVLLGLVFAGLALPILAIALYLHRAQGKIGVNQVMEQTLVMYHRFSVKEMLRVTKMYEAIVPATEFLNMQITPQQKLAYKELSQSVIRAYDVSKTPKWWRPEILRTYFFLIAYLDRNTAIVPKDLKKDLDETLRLVTILCEEFVKAAVVPRNRFRRGWFMPAEAGVQFQQCVVQQVRPEILSPTAEEKSKKKKGVSGEAAAALLQLPGITEDVVKGLEKPLKIKSIQDLAQKSESEREELLRQAGAAEETFADVHKMLMSLPHVHINNARAYVEEEDDIKEQDVLTVEAYVTITRASHASLDGPLNLKARGMGVQAFSPRLPHNVNEKWYVFLTNQRVETPSTWANSQPDLAEAEEAGAANFKSLGCQWASVDVMDGQEASAASSASTDTAAGATTATATSGAPKTNGASNDQEEESKPIGQKVQFKFMVQEPGKFNLSLVIMPSCWLGCNAVVPISFTALKQTAAEKAGKGPARGKDKNAPRFLDGDEVDDDEEDEDEPSDDDGEGWDSDETGTDVTYDEDPPDPSSVPEPETTDISKTAKLDANTTKKSGKKAQ